MSDLPPPSSHQGAGLWAELRRRNVIGVAGFYSVAAWLFVQVAETMLLAFDMKPSASTRMIARNTQPGMALAT